MNNFAGWHGCFLLLAILLEVLANVLLKYSDGFKKKVWGIVGILCILAAFSALAQAVKGIELAVAYAIWGSFGILATVMLGWILFKQRLKPHGWLGIILLVIGMGLLKLA